MRVTAQHEMVYGRKNSVKLGLTSRLSERQYMYVETRLTFGFSDLLIAH